MWISNYKIYKNFPHYVSFECLFFSLNWENLSLNDFKCILDMSPYIKMTCLDYLSLFKKQGSLQQHIKTVPLPAQILFCTCKAQNKKPCLHCKWKNALTHTLIPKPLCAQSNTQLNIDYLQVWSAMTQYRSTESHCGEL